jgi:hypothetical protein
MQIGCGFHNMLPGIINSLGTRQDFSLFSFYLLNLGAAEEGGLI